MSQSVYIKLIVINLNIIFCEKKQTISELEIVDKVLKLFINEPTIFEQTVIHNNNVLKWTTVLELTTANR